MLIKVISDTDICYAIVSFVIYNIVIIFLLFYAFFFLSMFTGGLLLEGFGHLQPPDEKFIPIIFFNVVVIY